MLASVHAMEMTTVQLFFNKDTEKINKLSENVDSPHLDHLLVPETFEHRVSVGLFCVGEEF